MDAVDRTRMRALVQHVRSRLAAGVEISVHDLAGRFGLDVFIVERLLESERGRPAVDAAEHAAPAPRGPTRELAPAVGNGGSE